MGKLGFWAIALMYLSTGIGSIFSTAIMNKIGDVKCMAYGSLFNAPWIMSLALAGMKGDYNPEVERPEPFYLKSAFIAIVIIILSILNGLG